MRFREELIGGVFDEFGLPIGGFMDILGKMGNMEDMVGSIKQMAEGIVKEVMKVIKPFFLRGVAGTIQVLSGG